VLNELARGDTELASRIVTASPRHGCRPTSALVSTARAVRQVENADLSGRKKIPSLQLGLFAEGQHIELGIAEMNLFILWFSALGLSHAINGAAAAGRHAVRPFISRLDALNYAFTRTRASCAGDAIGITLAPEAVPPVHSTP